MDWKKIGKALGGAAKSVANSYVDRYNELQELVDKYECYDTEDLVRRVKARRGSSDELNAMVVVLKRRGVIKS